MEVRIKFDLVKLIMLEDYVRGEYGESFEDKLRSYDYYESTRNRIMIYSAMAIEKLFEGHDMGINPNADLEEKGLEYVLVISVKTKNKELGNKVCDLIKELFELIQPIHA